MSYGSVIFDLDGVLLDSMESEEWKYEATRKALNELDVDTDGLDRSVLDSVLGDNGYEECVQVCGDLGVDPQHAWSLVAEKTSRARMEQIKENDFGLVEESRKILEQLRENEIKLAVISNAPEQAVELVINYFDLRSYFNFFRGVTSFEDLKDRKPHPNHLQLAKFQLKRDPFLYIGDRESDVNAATNADIDSIWIHPENCEEPTYTVESLDEIAKYIT